MDSRQRITDVADFTAQAMGWFNRRYRFTSDEIYLPYQPIYGFSLLKEHLGTYLRAYSILKAMECLSFASFLDVGCAEGYFPNMARHLFGARAYGCDFALSGVRRAWEIYHIPGVVADAHCLPFKDRAVDLVLCSEVIEHVADPEQVIGELTRICNKYLILTTPAARSTAEREQHFEHLDPNEIGGHVHFFMEEELRRWVGSEASVQGCIYRRMLPLFGRIVNGAELSETLRDCYHFLIDSCPGLTPETQKAYEDAMRVQEQGGLLGRLSGPTLVKVLLCIDRWLSGLFPGHTAEFLIIKPCHGASPGRRRRRIRRLLDYLLVENRVEPLRVGP